MAPDPVGSGAFASPRESIGLPPHCMIGRLCLAAAESPAMDGRKHNLIGGDRFRLGSIVPGEAGRESKVNS